LIESNDLTLQIIDCASEGIVVYDRDLKCVVWNRFMEELSGIRSSEILGKNCFNVFPHLREWGVEESLRKALTGKAAYSRDIYFSLPNTGKHGWFRGVYSPHYNEKDEIVGIVGVINDISHRKAIEEALKNANATMEQKINERTEELRVTNELLKKEIEERKQYEKNIEESEKKFRDTVNLLPQMVFEIDQDLKFTYVNNYCYENMGYSTDDLGKGVNIKDVVISDDLDKACRNIRICLEEKANFSGNLYYARKKDGSTFPAVVYSAPLIKDNEVVGVRGIVADITELKAAEMARLTSEEKYRLIIENVTDVVFSLSKDFRMFTCSPSAERIIGYKPEELIGRKINEIDIMNANCMETVYSKFACVMAGQEILATEMEFIAKDGTKKICELSGAPLYQNGEVVNAIFIARDITERKNAEEIIRKKERELHDKSDALIETNAALKVLIKNIEEEKKSLQEKFLLNIKELILPYVENIKKNKLNSMQATNLDIIESNLQKIASPFLHDLSYRYLNLTQKELQIALLIKEGKSTKDIAHYLNLSTKTVDCYRNKIRKKLNLDNKKMNLRTYLISLE